MIEKKKQYIFGALLVATLLVTVILNVSAATFDSDIVPNSNGNYRLGTSAGDWSSINDTIFFNGSNVGIADSSFSPGSQLHVRGDVRVEGGDVYVNSNSYGVILVSPDNSCWRLTVDDTGSVAAVSVTCP
jgi:hypothetical protein